MREVDGEKNLPVFLRVMNMEKEINKELRSLVHWSQLKGLPFGLLRAGNFWVPHPRQDLANIRDPFAKHFLKENEKKKK